MVERLERRAMEEGYRRAGMVPLPEEMDARHSHFCGEDGIGVGKVLLSSC
jgi:hypothetical protein